METKYKRNCGFKLLWAVFLTVNVSACITTSGRVSPPPLTQQELDSATSVSEPLSPCDVLLSPDDTDDLPSLLRSPPEDLGIHRIVAGQAKLLGDLRLWVGTDWLPQKVSSPSGIFEPYLRAAILPSHVREGIKPDNYLHAWISYQLPQRGRLRLYRWHTIELDDSSGRLVVSVHAQKVPLCQHE